MHGRRPCETAKLLCVILSIVFALPQFANSNQRMVETLIQTEAGKTKSVHLRPTSTRFDEEGKVDLHHGAEAMAVILGGSRPKRISKNVLDIGPTLRTRGGENEKLVGEYLNQ